MTGSDNFGVYMWEVPEKPNPENYIIKSASRILKGHRSLVNQVWMSWIIYISIYDLNDKKLF